MAITPYNTASALHVETGRREKMGRKASERKLRSSMISNECGCTTRRNRDGGERVRESRTEKDVICHSSANAVVGGGSKISSLPGAQQR